MILYHVGIALCIIFVFCLHHPLDQLPCTEDLGYMRYTHKLQCFIKASGYESSEVDLLYPRNLVKIESYHIWLEYYPLTFFGEDWFEKLNWVKLMNSVRLRLHYRPSVQAWRLQNVVPIWYSSKSWKISNKLRLGVAAV